MGWMPNDDGSQSGSAKPIWEYREGMEFLTVLPDESLPLVLLSGDMDPTRSWNGPMGVWLHEFKVANGFATVVCNKWEEACPFCYENEIYKKANPQYKNTGGRLPYGINKKALIQVYVPKYQKVLFFLAGKGIQDGMDFIISRNAQTFRNQVMITRIGKGLSTSYRVDMATFQLSEQDIAIIQQNTRSLDQMKMMLVLSQQEILQKTGVNSALYFQQRLAQNHGIDISGWGPVPQVGGGAGIYNPPLSSMNNVPPALQTPPTYTPPPMDALPQGIPPQPQGIQTSIPASMPPVQQPIQPGSNSMFNPQTPLPELPDDLKASLEIKCTVGVYVNQSLGQVFRQTGKPYAQYLARSGSDAEKVACQKILDNWVAVEAYITAFPF